MLHVTKNVRVLLSLYKHEHKNLKYDLSWPSFFDGAVVFVLNCCNKFKIEKTYPFIIILKNDKISFLEDCDIAKKKLHNLR